MDFCITIYNKFDGRGRLQTHETDKHFYFMESDWVKMAERIEWALNFPKPYLSLYRSKFDNFVAEAVKYNYTFIIPDYFNGQHTTARLIIEKNVIYGEKETEQGAISE